MAIEANNRFAEIIWAQTHDLKIASPADLQTGSPPDQASVLHRYRTAFYHLLNRLKDSEIADMGLDCKALPEKNSHDWPEARTMLETLQEAIDDCAGAHSAPNKIVFWPFDPAGLPVGSLPAHARWVTSKAADLVFDPPAGTTDEQASPATSFRVFFSRDEADRPEHLITSARAQRTADSMSSSGTRWLSAGIVVFRLAVFAVALMWVYQTGSILGNAHLTLAGHVTPFSEPFRTKIDSLCKIKAGEEEYSTAFTTKFCKREGDGVANWQMIHKCSEPNSRLINNGAEKTKVPGASTPMTRECAEAWQESLNSVKGEINKYDWKTPVYSLRKLLGSDSLGSGLLTMPFLVLLLAILVLFGAVGYNFTGSVWGILINSYNRVSLSFSQTAFWTVLIISGYGCASLINLGIASARGLDGSVADIFPAIDPTLFALMGITVSVPFVSTLIRQARPVIKSVEKVEVTKQLSFDLAKGDRRNALTKASVFDLFVSENAGSEDRIDLTRVQNVLFTVLLLIAYFSALISMLSTVYPEMIVATSAENPGIFKGLPAPGGSFLALIALSHAGYIMGKFSKPDGSTVSAKVDTKP